MRDQETASQAQPESPVVDYAFWDAPEGAAKVIYSLQLFHEIDFVVNEGYRKIPHGGIEVGGLLFGTIDGGTVRIETFRPIDCEHSSGPALLLSERDLTALQEQIAAAQADGELAKFRPIGWFLAHTRGPLELTETEAKQFDRFFPDALCVTVLVKPERFQPTRFGFLVRKKDGVVPREAASSAIILPLPGRSHKAGHLIASIPAPVSSTSIKRPGSTAGVNAPPVPSGRRRPAQDEFEDELKEDELKKDGLKKESPPPVSPAPAVPLSIWKVPPGDSENEAEQHARVEAAPDPAPVDERTPEEHAARRQLGRDRARIIEQAFALPPAAGQAFRPVPMPSLPANAVLPPPPGTAYGSSAYSGQEALTVGQAPVNYGAVPEQSWRWALLSPRAITALALAAVLGCLAGYAGYLQLPPPVIAMDVHPANQTIVVSWPQEQTRNAIYAAIRFNDGAPVPLSSEEKMAGQVALAATKDFKVEVIARNWIRDSRGVVRYVHSAVGGEGSSNRP